MNFSIKKNSKVIIIYLPWFIGNIRGSGGDYSTPEAADTDQKRSHTQFAAEVTRGNDREGAAQRGIKVSKSIKMLRN